MEFLQLVISFDVDELETESKSWMFFIMSRFVGFITLCDLLLSSGQVFIMPSVCVISLTKLAFIVHF